MFRLQRILFFLLNELPWQAAPLLFHIFDLLLSAEEASWLPVLTLTQKVILIV